MEQNNIESTHIAASQNQFNPEWIITLVLVALLGYFGIHRFYNGKIGTGILMIVTFGGLGIWVLIDIIMIVLGKFTTKQGKLITIKI